MVTTKTRFICDGSHPECRTRKNNEKNPNKLTSSEKECVLGGTYVHSIRSGCVHIYFPHLMFYHTCNPCMQHLQIWNHSSITNWTALGVVGGGVVSNISFNSCYIILVLRYKMKNVSSSLKTTWPWRPAPLPLSLRCADADQNPWSWPQRKTAQTQNRSPRHSSCLYETRKWIHAVIIKTTTIVEVPFYRSPVDAFNQLCRQERECSAHWRQFPRSHLHVVGM